jgi:predicted TIM-barrel fold metal-dependent hydrolase
LDSPLIAPESCLKYFKKTAIRDNVRPQISEENAMRLFGLA